ncbi:MAG TPA: TonB-dependent receptor [Bryobacteraceae bacterium]|nr:TonB-dependent receptor [Bryobacteraceae bacterium]
MPIVCAITFLQPAAAQVLYGSLVGQVNDASGAAVPGALVVVTQEQTQLIRKVATDASGRYTLPTLTPGDYQIKITAPGFKTFAKENVGVTLNSITRVDASLQVGQVNQTVEVTGAAPPLQTDVADVHHDLTADTIRNVPLPPGNNFETLFGTIPGINPPTTAHSIPTNPSRALQFNVNGTSEYGNDIRIDGVSQFNIWVPENAAYIPSSDAIQVVNAVTGNFNPEQGLAGGSTVNVEIKSGTNNVHGDVYEYHYNNNLEAHNFFDPQNKITRVPKDIFNQFGGSIGGPIKKDKLFYFGNVEATRQRQFATSVATVPTLAMMNGDLRGNDPASGLDKNADIVYDPTTGNANGGKRTPFPNNIIPASRISPVAQKLMGLLQQAPGRFLPSTRPAAPSSNYLAATDFAFDRITTDEKIDWNATNKLTMFAHLGYLNYNDLDPQMFGKVGGPPISGFGGNEGRGDGYTSTFSITGDYVVSPTFVLDGNFGTTKMVTNSRQLDLNKNWGTDYLGIPGTNGTRAFEGSWPRFGISNFTDLGTHNNYMPYLRSDPQFYWSGNATKIMGSHTVRFGGSIFLLHLNHQQPEWSGGGSAEPGAGGFDFGSGPTACKDCNKGKGSKTNAYNNFATFLLGLDTAYGKNILVPNYFHTVTHQYSLYVGDQWRVTPKLTLTLGTRWEYYPVPTRQGSRGLERYDFATNEVLLCGVANIPTDCGVSVSKKEFVPRVGVAYRMTPSFVIRAGYGITNEPYNLADDLRTNYPVLIPLYVAAESYQAAGALDTQSLQNAPVGSRNIPVGIPLPALPDTSSGRVPLLPNVASASTPTKLQRGYIQSWNFTLEKQFARNWVAQAGYVATRTIRQLGFLDLNAQSPILPVGCIPGSADHECGGNASRLFYDAAHDKRIAATSLITPIANNHYDGLQATLKHRFGQGYQLNLSYTWSKIIGIAGVTNEKGSAYIQTPAFYFLNRGLAPDDRPQNFEALFVAQPPFGAGRRWASAGIPSKILGGWQLSGVLSVVAGTPFELHAGGTSSNNLNATSGNVQRPDLLSSSIHVTNQVGLGTTWFDTSAFGVVDDLNRFGTSPFYFLHGPGMFNCNLALARSFVLTERFNLQFRAQAINFTNTPHFSNPNGDLNSSSFGQVNGLANTGRDGGVDARQLELSVRLSF